MALCAAILALTACSGGTGAAASDAGAAVPADLAPYVGTFAVEDENGRRLCSAVFDYEPSVGGEVSAGDCEQVAPDLAEALRFFADTKDGGIWLEDALHGQRATVYEEEGGDLAAQLASGSRVRLVAVQAAPELTPDEAARGRWRLVRAGVSAAERDCIVDLRNGGSVALSRDCPAKWQRYARASWRAFPGTVELVRPANADRVLFQSGGDPTEMSGPGGAWLLQRADPWPSR